MCVLMASTEYAPGRKLKHPEAWLMLCIQIQQTRFIFLQQFNPNLLDLDLS